MADDLHDLEFSKQRRCCFWVPFFSSELPSSRASDFWQRIKPVDSAPPTPTATGGSSASKEPWWAWGWKKVREWSELVAGPKWKTFIRGFGNKRRRRGGHGKFLYDPLSYARNFDEGQGQDGHFDEDLIGRGFSSRYSLPPSAKNSLDFDSEGLVVTVT